MIAAVLPPVVNRIASYIAPAPLPVPATPEAKQAAWGDALFAAALFYRARLTHPDPDVAERAARALFDLEKTRLRHGRDLAGATVEKTKMKENNNLLAPLPDLEPLKPPCVKPKASAAPAPPTEEERNRREDAERVKEIAKTEKFAAIVGTCRETLR